jgi:hypothetical protein
MKRKQKESDDFVGFMVIGVWSIFTILADCLAWPEAWDAIHRGYFVEHLKYSTIFRKVARREHPVQFWFDVGFDIAFGLIPTIAAAVAIYSAFRRRTRRPG